ncbi:hypothetical protein [Lysobacter silvisoli]|uniref:PNPLA domain-containing protein n=1 Tax=Lysobacter silvisoli TaxID=2293254 RepID=A0A371K6B8_9GAMM|nr:hypothetical protein [Lysobacter silvisoli]RDZ29404.1 hypothetical protein DX914_10070 [Lysobacter silvisoli]
MPPSDNPSPRDAQPADAVGRDAAAPAIGAAERAALAERRRLAGTEPRAGQAPSTIGLALSGGGVRSATFCLGLIRGLAQNGLLPRFDYLSTVSGGGYAGAALGRLIASLGIAPAQDLLKRSDTLLLAWLRRYGRYLAPRGARDYGIAIATYLRAGLAVHLEFALLAIAVGVLVVLPHLLQSVTSVLSPQDWSGWRSAWWPLAVLTWLLLAPGNLMAYWALRDAPPLGGAASTSRPRFSPWDIGMVLGAAAIAFALARRLSDASVPLPGFSAQFVALLMLLSTVGYGLWLWVRVAKARDDRDTFNARERDRLTAHLRRINLLAVALAALGAIDLASWWLLQTLESGAPWVYGSLGLGGLLVVVVRAFGEPIQRLLSNEEGPRPGLMPLLINVLGLGAAAVLLVLWVTVVQWWVFGRHVADPNQLLSHWIGRASLPIWNGLADLPLWAWLQWTVAQPTLLRLLWLTIGLLVWFLGTGLHTETVNSTSLHGFYRSRLTRAYLGVGNRRRFAGEGMLGLRRASPEQVSNVVDTVDGDDVDLAAYRPDLQGGPLHLINTCLNQTRGASSKLYNADRKGLPLVATAFGLEIGRDAQQPQLPAQRLDKLGRWIAVSGAAASPGAGSNTTPGWAMLLFLVGARLGYWFDAGRADAQMDQPALGIGPARPTLLGRGFAALARVYRNSKFGRLIGEATASFDGPSARAWYLSDGGHFDNTGVHPLLRRQLDFIVLADCGADPDYQFADLENLIRKARIDYGAEIEFYTEDSVCHLPLLQEEQICVLAPEKLHDNYTARGVMLARIRYRPDEHGRSKQGTLLVVKPNLHFALDSDVLAYARRNPKFPQQPTSDQFFDEAQWESYHRLGEDFGRALLPGWLEQLPGWAAPVEAQDTLPSLRRLRPIQAKGDEVAARPFWRPDTKAAAISAGLGAGLIATLAVPAWQVFDKLSEQRQQQRNETRRSLGELRKQLPAWARAGQAAPAAQATWDLDEDLQALLSRVYAQVRHERDTLSDAGRLVSHVQASCGLPPAASLTQACPPVQSAHRNLCSAVCDPAAANPYWQRSSDAAPLVSAVLESPEPARSGTLLRTSTSSLPAASLPSPSLPQVTAPQAKKLALRTPAQAVREDCAAQPVTVYVQVYNDDTRRRVQALPWSQLQPGASMPGVENVVRSARARNADAPQSYAAPTLIVHRMDDQGLCASALKDWLAPQLAGWYASTPEIELRKLPGAFKPNERVIELWLPNATSAQRGTP